MWGFHFLVDFLCGVGDIRDTQCGFKLFSRETAHLLFSNLHVERWAFDVELIYLAGKYGVPIKEVAVNWEEVSGSHLDPFYSSVEMGIDLVKISFMYTVGVWSSKTLEQQNLR